MKKTAEDITATNLPVSTMQIPSQGFGRITKRVEDVLLLCFYDPAGISTIPETVAFMQSASSFSVTVINLFEHRQDMGYLKLHPWTQFDRYAAVVIHNTVSYNVDNLRALDTDLQLKLKDYGGVKVLMRQDENFRFKEVAAFIGNAGFDLVLTCLPPEALPLVYPPHIVGNPRFERMLTGYVTPTLRAQNALANARPIDIGYRGSIQPLSFGRLAYEKRRIGDEVSRLLAGRDLVLDISSNWADRLGGDMWFDFLGSCKATLGAESGASIFDLNGDLDARCAALEARHKSAGSERQLAEAVLAGLVDLESNVRYHQISPRHFEAAACGAVQILYPGSYSGLLVAGRHYFELARDHSNLDQAVEFILDEARRTEMARAAFEEVVLNRENWIESFVEKLDQHLVALMEEKGKALSPTMQTAPAHNILLIAAHDPVIDPRLGWIEEGATGDLRVHQLGVLPPGTLLPRVETLARGNAILAYPRQSWRSGMCETYLAKVAGSVAGMAGAQELLFFERALQLSEAGFAELFGAPSGAARNAQFRWYLQYLLDTSVTLISRAGRMRGVHAIIATDLDTLPAALVLKGLLNVPVFYDAHEYWPEADLASFEYERQFWINLERRMVAHTDHRQTVSPGLAMLMSAQYAAPFEVVPNCEPLRSLLSEVQNRAKEGDACHFLFQGNFAVGRGIDLLINAWKETDARAVLQLRGPNNPYKSEMIALAESTGLLDTRIFFPEAVAETDMIVAASKADVGLIPYARAGTTYRHCCPNKMSQYMAAGLPILANATEFVAVTVNEAGCGVVTEFSRPALLVRAVNGLCADRAVRVAWGQAGREYFKTRFNWNVASRSLYGQLRDVIGSCNPESLTMFEQDDRIYLGLSEAPVARRAVTFLTLTRRVWRCLPLSLRRFLSPVARRLASRLGY